MRQGLRIKKVAGNTQKKEKRKEEELIKQKEL